MRLFIFPFPHFPVILILKYDVVLSITLCSIHANTSDTVAFF